MEPRSSTIITGPPTHPSTELENSNQPFWQPLDSLGGSKACLQIVCDVSGGFLEGVWNVSGGSLEDSGDLKQSFSRMCLDIVRKVSGRCLKGVRRVSERWAWAWAVVLAPSGGCQEDVYSESGALRSPIFLTQNFLNPMYFLYPNICEQNSIATIDSNLD